MTRALRSTALSIVSVLAFSATAFATDLRTSMMRAGLAPEHLAAAGVGDEHVGGIVAEVEESAAWTGGSLETADAAYVAAREDVDRLTRIVAAGNASNEDVADLAAAKTALTSAEAAQASVLTALFNAGKADLAGEVQTKLATIRANKDQDVPAEFWAVERTDEEWLTLKRLLAHERVCAKTGDEVDSGAAADLATLRAVQAVAAAKTALDANLADVQAAWTTATAE